MRKICSLCKEEKDFSEFYVRYFKDLEPVYRCECISCRKIRDKIYYEKNRSTNYVKILLSSAKRRAKRKGIVFNLIESDLIVPKFCPILGIELRINSPFSKDNSPSLDRLLPNEGYVKGNCFIISNKANRMKQDNSLEDLEKIIKYIKERLK